ncbi:lipoprotein [Pelagibaculum spongiae]|uniref:lipoprotein n=1 Tax=Pelagibaculum spongiae TaxID=2080658 RepID=UPI0034E26E4C
MAIFGEIKVIRSIFFCLVLSLGVGTTMGLAGCGQKGKLVSPASSSQSVIQNSDQGAP